MPNAIEEAHRQQARQAAVKLTSPTVASTGWQPAHIVARVEDQLAGSGLQVRREWDVSGSGRSLARLTIDSGPESFRL